MKLLVGLGNPGEKYAATRHNLGFMVLDQLTADWQSQQKFKSLIAKKGDLLLVKPQTMMNDSGLAVAKLACFYKVKPDEIWVIHDDLDLNLGKAKIKKGGASAGHHGVESIVKEMGTDQFWRVRLGIGRPLLQDQTEDYVLSKFKPNELNKVKKIIKKYEKEIVDLISL